MTIFSRSTIAVLVSLSLAACGGDDQSGGNPPITEKPAPVEPLPAQQINVQIGEQQITAMKESVVVDDLQGDAARVELEAFKGISYASAARFEHSQLNSLDTVTDATEFGDACPQNRATEQAQSEDCLNLNIWRPENTLAEAALPVYVFIHGGDFEVGSGASPLVQGDNVVAQGALDGKPFIAVTLNYRLGLLGSHWVDGTKTPEGGNFGLGDQKRALEWVNQNIDLFGGDPDNVTLIGQEAGAMSVGILQQSRTQENIAGTYFRRAIMQSNSYGFDYKSYGQAQTFNDKLADYSSALYQTENLAQLSLTELLAVQAKATGLVSTVGAWSGIDCIDTSDLIGSGLCFANKLDSEMTPQHHLKPFAPYIEYRAPGFLKPEIGGYHLTTQPAQTEYTVPTVVGFNSNDSATASFLPSLTSLIPTVIELIKEMNEAPEGIEPSAQAIQTWLASQDNLEQLQQRLQQLTPEQVAAQLDLGDTLPGSAYEAIVKFFFGLGNGELANKLFALTDYAPNDEGELSGAVANMAQFNQLTNDILFSGPAHVKAKQSSDQGQVATSLYQFAYKPSFNSWTVYNEGESIYPGDLVKSVSCMGKICSGTELPFIFNKPYNLAGSQVKPSSKDQQLMNTLSRAWFSDELFTDYQYDTATDRVLTIQADGEISPITDWDAQQNSAQDPELRGGRLSGLEDLGLIMSYFDK